MQTKCDRCGESAKAVGRLSYVRTRGFTQKLCKKCKERMRNSKQFPLLRSGKKVKAKK